MKVALIPCGVTEWRQEGRLLGRVALEPAPDAEQVVAQWAEQLRPVGLGKIFYAPDELSKSTARYIGRELNISAKSLDALVEVDLGLWAGLTETELKKRYAKAHRQLVDSPMNVSPPQGEDFSVAAERLRQCLRKRIRSNGRTAIGLVLRPITRAITRQVLEGWPADRMWEESLNNREPVVIDCAGVPELVTET